MGRDGDQHRTPTPPELDADEDDRSRADFPITPVRPPITDRGMSMAAGIVALVIGLAVLKPWAPATGDSPAAVPPRPPIPAATAAATPSPTVVDIAAELAAPVCLGAGAWRVASLETWRDQDVRVWRAVEPIADATGPLDPAIPTVPAVGLDVPALGWCAPVYGPERPVGPALVAGWFVVDGTAHELELRQVLPARGTTPLAALYQPIAPCPLVASCPPWETRAVPQRWETGRVVFRYEDRGAGSTIWFGADVDLYPWLAPGASALPTPID